ncbi:MAG: hypothetical protein ABID09_05300 [Candidatus Omnitrophota bacterium]
MAKKENLQKDLNRILEQAKEKFKVFGKELGAFAKNSEKEIVKASKSGKIQIDLMGLNVQKEKLYYDIGKKIIALNKKKDLGLEELKPFWNQLRKLEGTARKKKRELSAVRRDKK